MRPDSPARATGRTGPDTQHLHPHHMSAIVRHTIDSPVGPLTLAETDGALAELRFGGSISGTPAPTPLLRQAEEELAEYFAGRRRSFTLPLAPQGTPFQRSVWEALQRIPYGETCTYGRIAALVGRPKACRAVGMANHRNPLAIVIPCHRVVGSDGTLTGYAGGLAVKERLLRLEREEPSDGRTNRPRT